MASLLDRLLGRPEPVTTIQASSPTGPVIPSSAAQIEGKASFGTGVTALTYDMPISLLSENPQRKAREAMRTFRQGWVGPAERLVSGPASKVPWHLEDDDGETIDDSPALEFLRNPMPELRLSQTQVWSLTLRHMGLVGYTFWYLDQRDLLAGTPLTALYIRPDRMLPALNKQTGQLVGWVMDSDQPENRQPVAFSPDEIAVFRLDPDDDGILGVGIVEAAWRKLSLSTTVDRHTEKMIASGGRLAGTISPTSEKGSFTDDEYHQIVREMRNVTDSPDAAKKALIFKVPVDFTPTAATPSQMNLPDLNKMSRNDTFAHWHVSLSQSGITDSGRGLNSGETQKYEEASTWQNAREPRLAAFRETLQRDILDRWAILGQNVNLTLEVPTFDDETPLYDNAAKAKTLPLTINQRLEAVGKDPLDEAIYGQLGQAIYIDQSMVPVFLPAGVNVEKKPEPEPFGPQQNSNEVANPAGPETEAPGKASSDLRSRLTMTWEPKIRRATAAFLSKQAGTIAERVSARHAHLSVHPDEDAWWNGKQWDKELAEALLEEEQRLASSVHANLRKELKREGKADPLLEFVTAQAGKRIHDINETTRELLAGIIRDGLKAGHGPSDLARDIREATAFDAARSERISRTETGYAYNEAAIGSYRSLDVERVEVIDGDADEPCATANGSTWSLDEAESNPLGHPNCTRDFIPVIAKASIEPPASLTMPSMTFNLQADMPEIRIPEIHVPPTEVTVNVPQPRETVIPAPVVNVPAPIVNVEAPVVNMPEAKATLPQEVIVTSMPNRVHRVIRKDDQVVGSLEEDD